MSRPLCACGSRDTVYDTAIDDETGEVIDLAYCLRCGRRRVLRVPPTVGDRDVEPAGALTRTGWPSLDTALDGGLLPGLAVVAAPTGAGKTAWCVQLADQIAATGHPVLYVAVEPTPDEIRARLAAQRLSRAWRDVLISGAPTTTVLAGLRIYIVRDLPSVGVLDDIRLLHGIEPVVVVDHLHALARRNARGSERMVDPRRQVGDLTLTLSELAAQRRTVVVAAAQVARSWYSSRSDDGRERAGRDYIAAAKDAGEIEHDASYVIYLDVDLSSGSSTTRATIGVAKSRYSRSDLVVELGVDLAIGRYADSAGMAAPAVRPAAVARAERTRQRRTERDAARRAEIAARLCAVAAAAEAPMTREALIGQVCGRREIVRAVLGDLVVRGDEIVEVDQRAPRSTALLVWSRARAEAAGVSIRRPS